jgi:hypothetical protein
MLSDSERQVLARLEATLCRDDPQLAVALIELTPPRGHPWVRFGHDLMIVLAMLEACVCLVLHTRGTFVPGLAAAAFAVLAVVTRIRRFPRGARRRLQGYL